MPRQFERQPVEANSYQLRVTAQASSLKDESMNTRTSFCIVLVRVTHIISFTAAQGSNLAPFSETVRSYTSSKACTLEGGITAGNRTKQSRLDLGSISARARHHSLQHLLVWILCPSRAVLGGASLPTDKPRSRGARAELAPRSREDRAETAPGSRRGMRPEASSAEPNRP